jgi:hypothetical protein
LVVVNGVSLINLNGIIGTKLFADAAFDTDIRVDHMGLAAFASDGIDRAVSGTEGTTRAEVFLDFKPDEGFADFGGAAFLEDMRFVFIQEVFQRTFDRIRRSFSEAAKTVLIDLVTQIAQCVNVIRFALAFADPGENFENPAGPDTAGGALSAAFVLGEFHEEPGNINHAGVFIHDNQTA